MIDGTPQHEERAIRALERHDTRTTRQLIAAGSCWRSVMALSREGAIVSTRSNRRASLIWELPAMSALKVMSTFAHLTVEAREHNGRRYCYIVTEDGRDRISATRYDALVAYGARVKS